VHKKNIYLYAVEFFLTSFALANDLHRTKQTSDWTGNKRERCRCGRVACTTLMYRYIVQRE